MRRAGQALAALAVFLFVLGAVFGAVWFFVAAVVALAPLMVWSVATGIRNEASRPDAAD